MSGIRALLLAAGLGTRLSPMTEDCPKCLVPILGRPLLEYWLCKLYRCDIRQIIVNLHHHRQLVEAFLGRPQFLGWVQGVVEDELLGTAGTLRVNANYFSAGTTLLVHADNWCQCSFLDFINFHKYHRPSNTVMSMMTFRTPTPATSGVVEIDTNGVVRQYYEKVADPPGNLANGAVYLLEPAVVRWVEQRPHVHDFSTQVLPQFIGNIATWENRGIHRDIGTVKSLLDAQQDPTPDHCWHDTDEWTRIYQKNPIHTQLNEMLDQA